MNEQTNKPEITLRDGSLKATVWRNTGENGEYHAVNLAKTYTDSDGKPRDTTSFSQADLLRIAELSRETYAVINDIKREHPLERKPDQNKDREAFRSRRSARKSPEPDSDRGHGEDR